MAGMLGKRVSSRYELLSVVGGGGMANVYKARDLILDRIVAVKVLRSEFSDDEEFIRRFRREARSVASLSHPNIVNIYDIGDDSDDLYYIVMEYVEGETLKQLIKREAPLPLGQALHIMDRVTSAITHAHEHHIIHRDIKPHNILMDQNGNVKVTDFGIAVAMTSATITHTNSVIGSAHYFSPEQAKGSYANIKSDIYSLGIVLFEMLTGELPFSGTSPISIALKHLQEDIPDPRELNPAIPQSVENVILKALSKDPIHRYEKVEDMREDMRTALDPNRLNEPKFVIPNDSEETTKIMPIVAGGVSGGGNHNANGEVGGNGGEGGGQPPGDSKKKKKKRKTGKILLILLLLLLLIGGGIAAAFTFVPGLLHVEDVTVPDVTGIEYEKARDLLKDKNFQVDSEEVASDKDDEGIVMRQDPSEGRKVKEGSPIMLTVSTGPEKIKLDSYLNKDKDSVELMLKEYDFKDEHFTGVYSDKYDAGTVFEQDPRPGAEVVPEETELEFTYSKGSNVVEVPDLSGHSKDQAVKLLKDQGLNASDQGEEFSDSVDKGEVVRQSPDLGTEVAKGETVKFWTSKGAEPDPDTGPDKPDNPEPEQEPITFTQPIKVQGPPDDAKGKEHKPVDVKIVYSDADHDKETFVEEKIKETKDYELEMTVNPDEEVTVWVYTNGKLSRTINKKYDKVEKETD